MNVRAYLLSLLTIALMLNGCIENSPGQTDDVPAEDMGSSSQGNADGGVEPPPPPPSADIGVLQRMSPWLHQAAAMKMISRQIKVRKMPP